MQTNSRFAALALAIAFLLIRSPSAEALTFSFAGASTANQTSANASLIATSTWISLSDHFDQYSETRWEIVSAVEDSYGRIQVTYSYPTYGPWDSYGAFIDVQFQIHSGSGNLTPEPVTVELWGAGLYDWSANGGCCWTSETPTVQFWGGLPGYEEIYSPGPTFNTFAGTRTLLTNTSYALTYIHYQYVEGTPQDNYPPSSFSSWDAYNTFVDSNGMSGTVWVSAVGLVDFNMLLAPARVPEPGTLALLGLGLAGLGLTRRRKIN